jgi:cyclic beta-1,2-glucan synthetase
LYRAGLEWLLGFRLRENQLTLAPCVPAEWPGFAIEYRHRGTPYVITVDRQPPGAIPKLTVDGQPLAAGRNVIDLATDGNDHRVHVEWLSSPAEESQAASREA